MSDLTNGKGDSIDKKLVMRVQIMLNAGVEKSKLISKKIDDSRSCLRKNALLTCNFSF